MTVSFSTLHIMTGWPKYNDKMLVLQNNAKNRNKSSWLEQDDHYKDWGWSPQSQICINEIWAKIKSGARLISGNFHPGNLVCVFTSPLAWYLLWDYYARILTCAVSGWDFSFIWCTFSMEQDKIIELLYLMCFPVQGIFSVNNLRNRLPNSSS